MIEYPRLRDLPKEEREAFDKWLTGQTMPICDDSEPRALWDWYYPWDYSKWKAGRQTDD